MLFNSYAFLLVFLPIAILSYRLVDPYPQLRMPTLILLSFIFYGYWNVWFLPLLIASIVINWCLAKLYIAARRSIIITAAIVANLAVLGFFKYANFVAEISPPCPASRSGLSTSRCRSASRSSPSITSCIWSICAAAKRRNIRSAATRSTSVLSAGDRRAAGALVGGHAPVRPRRFTPRAGSGSSRSASTFIVIGLIEKTWLGDPIGRLLDPIYAQARLGPVPDGNSWLALGFSFQILFDFAGYSDIAIGLGLLFGVKLPYNFNAPFRSTSLVRTSGSAGT